MTAGCDVVLEIEVQGGKAGDGQNARTAVSDVYFAAVLRGAGKAG